MTSDPWQGKIHLYVDAELPEQEMREMDAHLRECAACAVEALRQVQLKQATRVAGHLYEPAAEFRQKMAAQLAGRGSVPWGRRWLPVVVAFAVMIIATGVLLNRWTPNTPSQQLLAELTDMHVANLASSTPVDVVSSDRHTVKPWFQGKLPFTFELPGLAGTPFDLIGGRVAYLDHEPGAQLIYDVGAHHISVFIFRDQSGRAQSTSSPVSSSEVLQFHVESWSAHGLRYFVVGDANPQAIAQLVVLLKQAGD